MKKILCKILSLLIVGCWSTNLVACDSSSTNTNETSSSSQNEIIEPISISLSVSNLELNKGETYQLYATISPSKADQSVVYSSVNESCATVTPQGLITAVDKGNTVIRAESANGLIATCNIEVSIAVGSIEGNIVYEKLGNSTKYNDIGAVVQLIPIDINSFPQEYDFLSSTSNYEEYGIYTAVADSAGNYKIENIPVGTYKMIMRSNNADKSPQVFIERLNNTDAFIINLYGEKIGELVNKSNINSWTTINFQFDILKSEITIESNKTVRKAINFIGL